MAKDTGAQVKEAYFPLECVPGEFKFQVVLKFVWQNDENILYYKNDIKQCQQSKRCDGDGHVQGLMLLARNPLRGEFNYDEDGIDADF